MERNRRALLTTLRVVGMVFAALSLLLLFFVPQFVDTRIAKNESSAVATLEELKNLEEAYAIMQPHEGYTCQLSALRPVGPFEGYDRYEYLGGDGVRVGYRFAVNNCRVGSRGAYTHVEITAVPSEPGKSGIRAFCIDEAAVMWLDGDGSAAKCLANKRPLR